MGLKSMARRTKQIPLDLVAIYVATVAISMFVLCTEKTVTDKIVDLMKKNVTEGNVETPAKWNVYYSRPVIGILASPACQNMELCDTDLETIPVSLVRWVQASGAQVIPI